ncbi:hypothetical protein QBC37DRAFT_463831 [Rhypophila decipiens]|uniref:Uncharacterized protein n=1 Tax=Rhypophila decipiens TaxID=261697 RepID=A0AAN6Y758_9PEZI|nr:hypothetical protein QBC37DRAFT_463831 [Rhypophila decipiens]
MSTVNLNPSRRSGPGNPAQDELDGMNIFWTIFALTCASSMHNLGSAPGFPASFRRYYFRVLPLCSLFDMLVMHLDFWTRWRQESGRRHGISIRQILKSARVSAREVAILRLSRTQIRAGDDQVRRHGEGNSGGMSANAGDSVEDSFLFDSWPRFFADAGLIFVYTKINGFRFTNAPLLHAIATVYFVSWFGMEIFLYLAFGFMIGTHGGSLATDVELRRASEKTRPLWSQSNDARKRLLRAIGLLLVVGQIMAPLSLFLPAAVDWSREALYGEGSALVSPPADREAKKMDKPWMER